MAGVGSGEAAGPAQALAGPGNGMAGSAKASGRLWQALAGSGRLAGSVWQALAGFDEAGRLWQALAGSGRLWQALAGSEKPASGRPVLFLGVTRFFVGFKGIIIFMRLYAS